MLLTLWQVYVIIIFLITVDNFIIFAALDDFIPLAVWAVLGVPVLWAGLVVLGG